MTKTYQNGSLKRAEKSAVVIIGAGFGDEGKGLLTDYHAAKFGADCIVARFNGGAQAGHTVILPDGRRHIFSHFGSGTLTGAATFLTKYFVSNPLLFRRERSELEKLSAAAPVVYADERGLVTTPYDMLINQWAEAARGSGKHGSCGIGFGETIERGLNKRFAVQISDLADLGKLRKTLADIRQNWTPARLHKLNVPALTPEQRDLLAANELINDFSSAAAEFYDCIIPARPRILQTTENVIFEGAQGLLLDEDYGWFPHVTRSSTGLKNVIQTTAEAGGIKRLDCNYAVRAYATRHGAGFLPHELPAKPYAKIVDLTNIPNLHQDNLRFGWLDLDLLKSVINTDFERGALAANINLVKNLAVTCLDQLDASAFYVSGGKLCETSVNDLLTATARSVDASQILASYGQTRETITAITRKENSSPDFLSKAIVTAFSKHAG